MPLIGLTCIALGKLALRGLVYEFGESAFERATDVYVKQCLWVELTCIILGVTFQRAIGVCMHYRIFIMDGGFGLACVTLNCFAQLFHGLPVDFDNDCPAEGRENGEIA